MSATSHPCSAAAMYGQDHGARLYCLPHAGGTAAQIASWLGALSPHIGIKGLDYPGHGARIAEPFAHSVAELVADLSRCIGSEASSRPLLLGHSLGAVVAFELTCALESTGIEIGALVVSGCPAPGASSGWPLEDDVTQGGIGGALRRLGGTPEEFFASSELLELFMPALRADFALAKRYVPRANSRIQAPILALAGACDDHAPLSAMSGWARRTTRFLGGATLPGGHFFLASERQMLATVLRRYLGPEIEGACSGAEDVADEHNASCDASVDLRRRPSAQLFATPHSRVRSLSTSWSSVKE